MDTHDINRMVSSMENETKKIKEDIFRLTWGMRGGVSSESLLYLYSYEDRLIMDKIIVDNIEATKKSGIAII